MEINTESYGIKKVSIKLDENDIKTAIMGYVEHNAKNYLGKAIKGRTVEVEIYEEGDFDAGEANYVAEVIIKFEKAKEK